MNIHHFHKMCRCGQRIEWAGTVNTPSPACPKCGPQHPRKSIDCDGAVSAALEQCERILDACDEVPERGEEFAESVSESVSEVMDTIERTRVVTQKQQDALDNWESGIGRWINR